MKNIFLSLIFCSLIQAQGFHTLGILMDDAFTPTDIASATVEFFATGDVGLSTATWTDRSGNGRTLTFTNTPTLSSKDGTPTVILNGTDEYGRLEAFTLEQPTTVIIVFKTLTLTGGKRVFDGNAGNSMGLFLVAGGVLSMYAGAQISGLGDPYGEDTWDMHYCVYNGAISYYQKNSDTPVIGNAGTNDAGGFNLGSFNGTINASNIEVIAICVISGVPNASDKVKLQTYFARYRDK